MQIHPSRRPARLILLAATLVTIACDQKSDNGLGKATASTAFPTGSASDPARAKAPEAATPCGMMLITEEGVGPFEIGGKIDDEQRPCDAALETLQTEFHRGRAYQTKGVTAFLNDLNTVTGLLVSSKEAKTTSGIGIGSSVSDLRRRKTQLCAGIGAVGLEVWEQGSGVVYVTDAASTVLGDAARDRFVAGARVPSSAIVTAIRLSSSTPNCLRRPEPATWSRGAGSVGAYLLDEHLITLVIEARNLPEDVYRLKVGAPRSEALAIEPAAIRVRTGLREGPDFFADNNGQLVIEIVLEKRRLGPDQTAVVILETVDPDDVRSAEIKLPRSA